MVVDVAEVVAFVELEAGQVGDLVDRAREDVALRRDHLAHRHELALEPEQALKLLVGGVREHRVLELVDLVVDVRQQWEEAVGQRVEHAVDQELLAVQHLAVELFALLVQRRQRIPVDRDHVLARDEQMHLAQRVLRVIPAGAIEHQEHVVAVVVELGPLVKLLAVLDRQRVKAEQLLQLAQLLVAGRCQIQPEEMVAIQVILDPGLIEVRGARSDELKVGIAFVPR